MLPSNSGKLQELQELYKMDDGKLIVIADIQTISDLKASSLSNIL